MVLLFNCLKYYIFLFYLKLTVLNYLYVHLYNSSLKSIKLYILIKSTRGHEKKQIAKQMTTSPNIIFIRFGQALNRDDIKFLSFQKDHKYIAL